MTDYSRLRDRAHARRVRNELVFTTTMILAVVALVGVCFLITPAEAGPPKGGVSQHQKQQQQQSATARAQGGSSRSSTGDTYVDANDDYPRTAAGAYAPTVAVVCGGSAGAQAASWGFSLGKQSRFCSLLALAESFQSAGHTGMAYRLREEAMQELGVQHQWGKKALSGMRHFWRITIGWLPIIGDIVAP